MQNELASGETSWVGRVVRWSLVALLGLAAGIVTMVATLPVGFAARMAGLVVPADVRLTGTVWNGAAEFALGHRAAWQSQAGASLRARAWVANVQITGPQTQLAGQWQLHASGGGSVAPLRGNFGWTLIDAIMPGLEITCDTMAMLELDRVGMGPAGNMATGQVHLAQGTCARVDGSITGVPMPELLAVIGTTDAGIAVDITPANTPDVVLGNLLITPDDRLRVTILAAGAAMVPGLPTSGDSQIELPLALFAL